MDDDQFALFDAEPRERMKAVYEAGERWERRVEHLRVCTVEPWWDSPYECTCQEGE